MVYSWTTAHRRPLVFDCFLAFSARFKRCCGLRVWCVCLLACMLCDMRGVCVVGGRGVLNACVASNLQEACHVVKAGLCVMLARA